MNIIEENLEKALDGEFFSSISEEYFFKTILYKFTTYHIEFVC